MPKTQIDVDTLLAFLGNGDEDNDEPRLLAAADQRAKVHLSAGRGVMMSDDSDHYRVFEEVAFRVFKDWPQAGREQMDAWNNFWQEARAVSTGLPDDDPSAAACALYAPQLSAAYYFGLAIGLRLGGGGGR